MNISLAPMEGIITYIFRNAYVKYYGAMDRYYTPFITSPKLGLRDFQEVDPAKNQYSNLIPQVLTNKADTFLEIAGELGDLGYKTINLNLGCPSGTVVGKHRGSGLLRYPDELEAFLDEIYSKANCEISLKTRIGFDDEENLMGNWERILGIYSRYPFSELIIHPRLRSDMYKGPIRGEAFDLAYRRIVGSIPLTYNGDLLSGSDIDRTISTYPGLDGVMIGRGILRRPWFVKEYRENIFDSTSRLTTLRAFHDDIYNGYREIMSGEKPVIFKMKEIWGFMGHGFEESEKVIKMVQKTNNLREYRALVNTIFNNYKLSDT